jgi:hypothetical protein
MKHLVNANQTPEMRRTKYNLAIEFGANPSLAYRMRDWHSPKIFRAFNKPTPSLKERREMGLLKAKIDTLITKMESHLSNSED